jgi:hypothetical protein
LDCSESQAIETEVLKDSKYHELGKDVIFYVVPRNPNALRSVHTRLSIALGDILSLQQEPIPTALERLTRRVEEVIEDFERRFFS